MLKKNLKIGCVGLRRGRDLLSNVLYIPNVTITSICDMDNDTLQACENWLKNQGKSDEFKCFRDYNEMLQSDIDAVIIATEASAHVSMSIEALKAGKHVLSEVPAIHSVDEAIELYKAVRQSGCKYMLAENCCFWAFIDTWKHMLKDGLMGDVWYAEAEYLHNIEHLMRDKNGNPTWRASYNAIQYLTHDLGPLLYIMNDYCVSVSGFAPDINPISEYSSGTPNEVAIFKTAKGALIKILVAFGIQMEPERHNFSLFGSKGTLETTRSGEYSTIAYLKSIPNTTGMIHIPVGISYIGISQELLAGHGGADYFMIESFIKSIIEDKKPLIDVEMAIRMSLPGIFAHISKEQNGAPVLIPDIAKLCE